MIRAVSIDVAERFRLSVSASGRAAPAIFDVSRLASRWLYQAYYFCAHAYAAYRRRFD